MGSQVGIAQTSSTAELDLLALAFDIELSETALKIEQKPLSNNFSKTFRLRENLTQSAIEKYFKDNPEEILAFRRYCQRLHDLEILTYQESMSLIRSAVQGFSANLDFIALSPATPSHGTEATGAPTIKTSSSPSEKAIKQAVETWTRSKADPTDAKPYTFGTDLSTGKKERIDGEALQIMTQLEAEKKRKRLEAQAAFLMQQLAQSNDRKQTLLERVNSILSQHTEQAIQEKADEIFDNADISITNTERGPEFNARVLKAFDPNPNDGLFNYGEIGLVDIEDRQTLNVGIGIRALDPTERVMYGANMFFDQEFPYNHQRASVGIEMATSPFRFNANRYHALSGGKGLSDDITERAVSGQDVRTKIAFPYLPNLFLDYTKFEWFGKDGLADVKGQTVGISGALSDSLSLEIARKVYSNAPYPSENSARLTYRYTPGSQKSASMFTPIAVPYTLERLDAREKYAMTNRENEIQKQQSSPGLQVTFTSL